MTEMQKLLSEIAELPSNGRIYFDAGGRGMAVTNITTAKLQSLRTYVLSLEEANRVAREALDRYGDKDFWCVRQQDEIGHTQSPEFDRGADWWLDDGNGWEPAKKALSEMTERLDAQEG